MRTPDSRGIYFNSDLLGEPDYNYVCWIDVMGTANQMLRSLPISANFIFKLHCAILEACESLSNESGVWVYPVMDGVYVTACDREPLQLLITHTLRRVVMTFVGESKQYHRFLVRGAIAFGPVYHGYKLDNRTNFVRSYAVGHGTRLRSGTTRAWNIPQLRNSYLYWKKILECATVCCLAGRWRRLSWLNALHHLLAWRFTNQLPPLLHMAADRFDCPGLTGLHMLTRL